MPRPKKITRVAVRVDAKQLGRIKRLVQRNFPGTGPAPGRGSQEIVDAAVSLMADLMDVETTGLIVTRLDWLQQAGLENTARANSAVAAALRHLSNKLDLELAVDFAEVDGRQVIRITDGEREIVADTIKPGDLSEGTGKLN